MKSYRDKIKMEIDQGAFEKALGEERVLGTVLQSKFGDDGPETPPRLSV